MKTVWAILLLGFVGIALLADVNDAAKCKGRACGKPRPPKPPKKLPKTCLDHLKAGKRKCGVYRVYDDKGNHYPVYCDMKSDPGNAWTLITSYSLKNRAPFQRRGFPANYPINENIPNWNLYRLSKNRMIELKAHSTHWRATCSFPTSGIDYTDYVRGTLKDFDILAFTGSGACKKVEYINVRGHFGFHLTTRWWQHPTNFALHMDSHGQKPCQFDAKPGSINSEDNFGYYGHVNNKFRCSASDTSTTQWWIGGHI